MADNDLDALADLIHWEAGSVEMGLINGQEPSKHACKAAAKAILAHWRLTPITEQTEETKHVV